MVAVTTHYLEMTSPAELRPATRLPLADGKAIGVVAIDPPLPELNRFFYATIGGDWHWIDRLSWNFQRWSDYLAQAGVETWMLSVGGVPAGYIELDGSQPGEVEIAYFGLLTRFVGQGLGGYLLTTGVERAFATGARRVWVHTCNLDHPAALPSYRARGFKLYKSATAEELLPPPPGPWPGARAP